MTAPDRDHIAQGMELAAHKISANMANARECSRFTWRMSKDRTQYRQVKAEAVQNARHWQAYRDTLASQQRQKT